MMRQCETKATRHPLGMQNPRTDWPITTSTERMRLAYSCAAVSDLDSTTIETWRTAGLVYLVGSYISIFPPTNLPTGQNMGQAIWERILREV